MTCYSKRMSGGGSPSKDGVLGWPTILRLLGLRSVLRTQTGLPLLRLESPGKPGPVIYRKCCAAGGQKAKGKIIGGAGQREFPCALGLVWGEKEVRSLCGSNL